MMEPVDRQRGTLLGLATGDALGAAVEFQPPGTFEPVTGYRGGGPHGLASGEWTDDTSMALALADSIAEVGWDINDQAERYLKWWRTGKYSVNGRCFDIGNTTIAALQRFQENGAARMSSDPSSHASGNGSIMRLAPVPIRYSYMLSVPDDEPCAGARKVGHTQFSEGICHDPVDGNAACVGGHIADLRVLRGRWCRALFSA